MEIVLIRKKIEHLLKLDNRVWGAYCQEIAVPIHHRHTGNNKFYPSFSIYPFGTFFLHRWIAWRFLNLDENSGLVVDHINGDTLDGRIANLRVCTSQQNQTNMRIGRNNRTGMKGVGLYRGRYRARFTKDGKIVCIGTFKTALESAKAVREAAMAAHGEFVSLDFSKPSWMHEERK